MNYARDPSQLHQTPTNPAEAKETKAIAAVAKQEGKQLDTYPIEKITPLNYTTPTYRGIRRERPGGRSTLICPNRSPGALL